MNTLDRALYRAKNVSTGKWAYFGIMNTAIKSNDKEFFLYKENSGTYSFDSVSQFTGLTDKNGKRIFEGDKLAWGDKVAVIGFSVEDGAYVIMFSDGSGAMCNAEYMLNFEVQL